MQWHTPIGYSIREGKIIINEKQSQVVKRIFADYDAGISLIRIAEDLKAAQIPNAQGRIAWTHGTVGRVLQNYNYLGTEYYPQLIDKELFDRVQERRQQKGKHLCRGKHRPSERERILFSGMLVCGECGQTYSHIQPKRRYQGKGKAKWKCKNYLYQNQVSCKGGFITDDEVMEATVNAINQVIENRRILNQTEDMTDKVSKRYRELDRQISDEDNTEDMMTLLYERASERYKTLNVRDTEQNTAEMTEILDGMEKLESFNEEAYRQLITQMVVYKDYTVKVIFKNGSSTKIGYGNTDIRKGESDGSKESEESINDSCQSQV